MRSSPALVWVLALGFAGSVGFGLVPLIVNKQREAEARHVAAEQKAERDRIADAKRKQDQLAIAKLITEEETEWGAAAFGSRPTDIWTIETDRNAYTKIDRKLVSELVVNANELAGRAWGLERDAKFGPVDDAIVYKFDDDRYGVLTDVEFGLVKRRQRFKIVIAADRGYWVRESLAKLRDGER